MKIVSLLEVVLTLALVAAFTTVGRESPKSSAASRPKLNETADVDRGQRKPEAKPIAKSLMQPDGHAFTPSYLLNVYESNEISADQLYRGKRVFVEARVGNVGRDLLGKPYVILRNRTWEGGSRSGLRSVQAFFPDSAVPQLAHLQPGDIILLTGTCDGLMLNLFLQDSVLEFASSFRY
jgi:hypothetical protein